MNKKRFLFVLAETVSWVGMGRVGDLGRVNLTFPPLCILFHFSPGFPWWC